ncbi:MAG: hypothetical protein HYS12_11870 [Planctomycetes bacterium]|nr:hypothetical protein [Planctomycetota bacterium]
MDAQVGTLTLAGPVQNDGTLAATAGALKVNGPLTIDGAGVLASWSSATVTVGGQLLGSTRNADRYDPQGMVRLDGPGTATQPQLLEVMGRDLGPDPTAFPPNFAYGTLALANTAFVKLVDQSDNAAGTGPEALYVNTLVVPAGTTLDLNGLKLYARAIQVSGTVLGGSVEQIPDGGPIAFATPTPGTIAPAGNLDEWTFFGRAGQSVTVFVNPGSGGIAPPTAPQLGLAEVRLLDAANKVLATASNSSFGDVVSFSDVPLPADGTYRIQVRAAAGNATATGNYTVTLWNVTSHEFPLTLNQPVAGRIDTPYGVDRWTFSAQAGQTVQFDLFPASSGVAFDLRGPNGWVGFTNRTARSDPITLPASGSYVLSAHAIDGAEDGSYAFRMLSLDITPLTLGQPYHGTIAGSGHSQLFRVDVPVGMPMMVSLDDISTSDHNELYARFGTPPTRSNALVYLPFGQQGQTNFASYYDSVANYDYRFTDPGAADQKVLVPLATPGTWYFLLYSDYAPQPGSFTLLAQTAGVFLQAVTPDHHGNGAPTTLTLTGAGFDHSTTVEFVAAGGTAYPASTTSVDSFTRLTATFAAGAVPPGVYTVRVSRPGGDTAELPAAFRVTAGGAADLRTNLVVPSNVGRHTLATLSVEYTNAGDVAMPSPLLVLHGSDRALLTLDPAVWVRGLWTPGQPLGFSDTVQFLASGATPGVLQPGESGRVTVYFAGLQQPWDLSDTQVDFNLGVVSADSTAAMDWGPLEATLLDRETDASVDAPGLALTFDRMYGADLVRRYELGPLGRGWSYNWQSSLRQDADGTVRITGPGGAVRVFQPDSRGGYFAQAGDFATLTADGGGFRLRETDGTTTAFNADGTLAHVEDANGNRINAGYTAGRLTSLTHSSGQSLQIAYNAAGRISTVTDSAGRQSVFTYDAAGEHLIAVRHPDGQTTRYTYDTTGAPATLHALTGIAFPGGTHRTFAYDSAGRLVGTALDGGAEALTVAYVSAGEETVTDATGGASELFFDERGLLAKSVDPLENATFFTHDRDFNLTRVTDATGQITQLGYDDTGHLTRFTDVLGHETRFAYAGPFSFLTSFTDARGNTTRYTRDTRGNVLGTVYPDGSAEQLTYDPFGDPLSLTNRRGDAISYTRDPAGRLTGKTYPDGSQVTFSYDARGNLISATDASGVTTLDYDTADRLVKITYPTGRFLAFTYDAAGRRTQSVDQDGFTVNYQYDAAGRLAGLADGSGGPIVAYTYDATGRLSRKENGNGTFTTYEYDQAGQLLHLVNHAPDDTVQSRFDYTYDALGRRTSMGTVDGMWTYSYDGTGQLTRAVFRSTNPDIPDQDLQYVYDSVGNRVRVIENGVTTEYTTNNLNQYVTVGTARLRYDADGNLVEKVDGTEVSRYFYDAENRLVRVETADGTWEYQYDAFGNRVATTHDSVRVEYLLDPSRLVDVVGEYNAGGLVAHYTHGLGLSSRIDASGSPAYYDFDAMGSTVGLSGTAGTYESKYTYLPFGDSLNSVQSIINPFQFIGEYGVTDEINGLKLMGSRFYDTEIGRFSKPDPFSIRGGLNLYTYVQNNPISLFDPAGASPDNERVIRFVPGPSGEPVPVFVDPDTGRARIGPPDSRPPGELPEINPILLEIGVEITSTLILIGLGVPAPWAHGIGSAIGVLGHPGTAEGDGGTSVVAGSSDPNEKTGPAGYGPASFIAVNSVLPYRINFENEDTATAPAQGVGISDQLDPNLDWSTFELTDLGFGDHLITVPAGSRSFQTTLPITSEGRSLLVQVEAGIDAATGRVHATFQTLDPVTGLPPDVLAGFLPPENGTGRGMGHISYLVRPKPGLPTGTELHNVAQVTFDGGEVVATNQTDPHNPAAGTDPAKEARNTIDAVAPTSSVQALPAVTSTARFIVSWSGADDPGGSGIASYDVFVSDNARPFTPFLTGTTQTSIPFTGQFGHTYGFFTVATDNVGHRQATPAAAQATTLLEPPPPPPPSPPPPPPPAPQPFVSTAFGPLGAVYEIVSPDGMLTQVDASGAHVLAGGVRSASVSFGPSGQVLEVVFLDGTLLQADATGAHVLAGGIRSASLGFGPSGPVYEIVSLDGTLTQYDASGAHVLAGGVRSASIAFSPVSFALLVTLQDGTLIQVDTTGAHVLAGGVLSASIAYNSFGPSGTAFTAMPWVLDMIFANGLLMQFDGTGLHPLAKLF